MKPIRIVPAARSLGERVGDSSNPRSARDGKEWRVSGVPDMFETIREEFLSFHPPKGLQEGGSLLLPYIGSGAKFRFHRIMW
jgi:hypothetical protein